MLAFSPVSFPTTHYFAMSKSRFGNTISVDLRRATFSGRAVELMSRYRCSGEQGDSEYFGFLMLNNIYNKTNMDYPSNLNRYNKKNCLW